MRFQKLFVICILGLAMLAGVVQARRLGRHRRGPQNFVPVYRAMDEQQFTMPTTAEQETERQPEPLQPKPISSTKFLLLKTAANARAAPTATVNPNAGRTFKKLLLYKNLLSPPAPQYGFGGFGAGFSLPYIIINNPTNLTNINNNTLGNTPAPTAPATTTTGTGTGGTGTGTGGTGTGAGTRIGGFGGGGASFANFFKRPPQQALPMAIPMPTQIYQQRETNGAQAALPYDVVAMLGMNGLSGLVPVGLPVQPNLNQNRRRKQPQRRRGQNAAPQTNPFNPFAALANSFRGLQLL